MKTIYADEMSPGLVWRAWRAHMIARRVLLHEGQFWHVSRVRGTGTYAFDLELARRSIDDCTPAEWDAASRAARNTY